jgi:hypothetical protein
VTLDFVEALACDGSKRFECAPTREDTRDTEGGFSGCMTRVSKPALLNFEYPMT